jgi:hypothetical protein
MLLFGQGLQRRKRNGNKGIGIANRFGCDQYEIEKVGSPKALTEGLLSSKLLLTNFVLSFCGRGVAECLMEKN